MPLFLQTKLVVNQPGDAFEQEADAVAQRASTGFIQRECAACSTGEACPDCEDEELVQRQPAGTAGPGANGGSSGTLPLPDSGSPLSGAVRDRVEPVLGSDLSSVRVHDSPAAQQTAVGLDAKAFTHRNHIWLGPGQSSENVDLMAHEATHVVQQRAVSSGELVQRRPEDYAHPEDGVTVQHNMGEQVAEATEQSDGDDDSPSESPPPTVSRAEREEKKGELEPYSHPPADRAAEARPQVEQSASTVQEEDAQPSEPLAQGQEQTPQEKPGPAGAADQAASLADAAFARAAAQPVPETPPPVQPPLPVAPLNAEAEPVQPDTVADEAAVQLSGEVQRMRNEGLVARQRATALRANADRLRGNLRLARGATETAENGLEQAQGHVESRREIASQARDALGVSEEKAATVAAEAPEYATRATTTHEDSGPMAEGAREKAGESRSESPDDEEAAEKMQEQAGQMQQVDADATSVDSAVTGTQARGEALVEEAAQAAEKNTATAGKLDSTDAAIEQTDSRLTELDEQNAEAQARIAGVEQGPAQLDRGAAHTDTQAQAIIAASNDLEAQIQGAQDDFATDMESVPGSRSIAAASENEPPATVQRDAQTAYGDRIQVDILSGLHGPASAAAQHEQAERAQRAAERRRTRLREINERANGHFENLSAIDKMGMALDITGENLMGDLGEARWPHILGQMALAFVDPAVSLEGVVSGLNMTLSGAANLFSLQQWERDPLGNLLKSAADIATGLTIILGSIAGLCTAILVILGALAIITFGAMGPAFAAASAFLGPIITTVGGWAISCAAIAAELQFYVLIKNLVDAATASTAEQLEHESDQMTEDATQAAGMAAQVVTAGVMEAGGAALADTAVGQRLGSMATSVGERFDMLPPPRGTPVIEPGAASTPETPVTALEAPAAPAEAPAVPAETPGAPSSAPSLETPGTPAPAVEAPPPAAPAPVEVPAAPETTTPTRASNAEPPTAPAAPAAPEPPAVSTTPEPTTPVSPELSSTPATTEAPVSAPASETPPPDAASGPSIPESAVPEPPASESPTPESATPETPAENAPAPAKPMTAAQQRALARLRRIFEEDWGLRGQALEERMAQVRGDPEAALRDLLGFNPRRERPGTQDVRDAMSALDDPVPEDPATVPDDVPEGGLFDDPNAEPMSPERAREAYMGGTPSKFSETGAAVVERMRSQGRIEGKGPLLPGNPNGLKVKAPDGSWHLIDETIDMAHYPVDAVTWWNNEGRFFGARSGPVREFMTEPNNYRLEPRSSNRSAGAKIGDRYLPPEK